MRLFKIDVFEFFLILIYLFILFCGVALGYYWMGILKCFMSFACGPIQRTCMLQGAFIIGAYRASAAFRAFAKFTKFKGDAACTQGAQLF